MAADLRRVGWFFVLGALAFFAFTTAMLKGWI